MARSPGPSRSPAAYGVVVAFALSGFGDQAPLPRGEVLIERTVAIVGGAVVTRSDVELAVTLGLVTLGPAGAAAATSAVIDRWLMLHEVARFSPTDPDPVVVEARLEAVRARAGGEAALADVLTRAGFTPVRLAAWVRDDLRITAYLDQRFASVGAPAEVDVTAYVAQHRAELEREGIEPEALAEAARTRLVADRRRELIADWLSDLRRRTEVVEFRRPPGD